MSDVGESRSSADLQLEASQGGLDAIEVLLVRHLAGLRSYVRLRAGANVLAREAESDIVQSVCRELLTHEGRFRYGGEAGFRHWLYTTALRKIVDHDKHHTAQRRDVRREEVAASSPGLPDAAFASPSGVAVGREEIGRVAAALDRLEPDAREVILLSRVVGLGRADVAAEMGRTEDSIRNLLHRSLARLAAHLDAPSGPPTES